MTPNATPAGKAVYGFDAALPTKVVGGGDPGREI